MTTVNERDEKEILSGPQRIAELFFATCMVLLLGFLLIHQINETGFFTEKFGTLAMVCLYGPLVFGISPPVIRALTGQRQPARPFEAVTGLLLGVGSLWLVIVFPFDYAHLADILPGAVRFVLAWVTDDLARIVLALQVIIGPISALVAIWKYLSMRQQPQAGRFA